MPDVFYDSCDKMFENEDRLIQEYLDGKYPTLQMPLRLPRSQRTHTNPRPHYRKIIQRYVRGCSSLCTWDAPGHPHRGRGGFPADQVRFTEHCNFDGWDKRFGTGDMPDVGKAGMSGGISAVQVGAGVKLIMYSEPNYKGEKKSIKDPQGQLPCQDGWNDRCRSLKIVSK